MMPWEPSLDNTGARGALLQNSREAGLGEAYSTSQCRLQNEVQAPTPEPKWQANTRVPEGEFYAVTGHEDAAHEAVGASGGAAYLVPHQALPSDEGGARTSKLPVQLFSVQKEFLVHEPD